MIIPGRAHCNCFLDKYIHNAKTGKFNRDEYKFMYYQVSCRCVFCCYDILELTLRKELL